MKKKNPGSNTYYWRAVHRLAEHHGVTIARARRMNWEKEVHAEYLRRSKAHLHPHPKPIPARSKKVSDVHPRSPKPPAPLPKRISEDRKRKSPIPSRGPAPKLKIKEYDRLPRVRDDEEFEEFEEWEEEWETDWSMDYPELNDMDDIEDFLDTFEHEEGDRYKEMV